MAPPLATALFPSKTASKIISLHSPYIIHNGLPFPLTIFSANENEQKIIQPDKYHDLYNIPDGTLTASYSLDSVHNGPLIQTKLRINSTIRVPIATQYNLEDQI